MKYRGATIEPCGTEKFPDMVGIVKTTKKVREMNGKRYIDEHHAQTAIDAYWAETFIEKTKIKAFDTSVLKLKRTDMEE